MKRALIGGFYSLVGSIWVFAVLNAAGNNLANSWDSRLGRLLSTVVQMNLLPLLILAILLVIAGIGIMTVELFRKE